MEKSFELEILASDHLFFSGRAINLVIPVTDGYFGIKAHHDDIVLCMVPGTTHFDPDEEGERLFAVTGQGIAMMRNNKATLLLDTAERPEDIDEKRARLAMEQAKEEIRQKKSIEEYQHSQAALAKSMARLSGKHYRDRINL